MINAPVTNSFFTCKTDQIFKTIIANSNNPKYLEIILSEIMNKKIKVDKFLLPELKIKNTKERVKTLDVLVKTNDGYFNIELNTNFTPIVKLRNYYYYSGLLSGLTSRGKEYNPNLKVTQINLTFNMSYESPLIEHIVLTSKETKKEWLKNLQIININMDKLKELWYSKIEEVTKKYKHVLMLDLNKEELMILGADDEIVKEYGEELMKINEDGYFVYGLTPEEDARAIAKAERKLYYDEGKTQGFSQGMSEGKNTEKINIAKKMLQLGLPINNIKKCTGLSTKTIKNIVL